jgi:acetoin utilization deacetylase AcuC-like enzyme
MRAPFTHHPAYVAKDVPEGHRFPMQKFGLLAERLIADGLVAPGGFYQPIAAPFSWLTLAHDPAYVEAVLTCRVDARRARRIGFAMLASVAKRSVHAVAGTVLAARLALEHGLSANTAGGSHHADWEGGAGFCVFNDVAVAIRVLQAEGMIKRALVIDLDVHQGDGTARIFAHDASVTTVSVHCQQNFPLNKAISDFDRALPKGTGDAEYLAAVDEVLDRFMRPGAADIVFYVAGVDPHIEDRLGYFAVSDAGLCQREHRVIAAAQAAGLPLCGVLGGGYAPDLDALVTRHAYLHHAIYKALMAEQARR